MKHAALSLVLASSLPLAGCLQLDDGRTDEVASTVDIAVAAAADDQMPRGSYMVIPPEYAVLPGDDGVTTTLPHASWIFYMNRAGGTYTPGNNNSTTNRSSIPRQTSVVQPWNVSEAGWNQVMTCVRQQFAAYDVEITDVDPGNVPHIESVVAGRPGDLQLPNGVGGVSPFTSNCSVIQNSIVFTFAEVYGTNYQVICEVVAQEVAHSFGLDHQYLCADPMTYLGGCGAKSFQNVDAQCGEDVPRTCACGQATQNSVEMLSARVGIKNGDTVPPTIGIQSPVNGATVPPGFTVNVAANDDVGVARVELYIDGTLADTSTTPPFSLTASANLANGTYLVETRAYDATNVTSDSISVTVQAGTDPGNPGNPGNPGDPGTPTDPGTDSPSELVGGCSAGGSSGAGALLLFVIGLVFVGRRRVH